MPHWVVMSVMGGKRTVNIRELQRLQLARVEDRPYGCSLAEASAPMLLDNPPPLMAPISICAAIIGSTGRSDRSAMPSEIKPANLAVT